MGCCGCRCCYSWDLSSGSFDVSDLVDDTGDQRVPGSALVPKEVER
jgi:hypothetical protein